MHDHIDVGHKSWYSQNKWEVKAAIQVICLYWTVSDWLESLCNTFSNPYSRVYIVPPHFANEKLSDHQAHCNALWSDMKHFDPLHFGSTRRAMVQCEALWFNAECFGLFLKLDVNLLAWPVIIIDSTSLYIDWWLHLYDGHTHWVFLASAHLEWMLLDGAC